MSSQEIAQPEVEQIAAPPTALSEAAGLLLARGYGILMDDILYQVSAKPIAPLPAKSRKHKPARNLSAL